MSHSVEQQLVSRIYGNGRGWTFSQMDFSGMGSRSAVDITLHRLSGKGTIRRLIRGIYDYPKFSRKLNRQLGPDIDQVASALARKFGWRIQATGPAALNLLGLSTQMPGRFVYLSDGPGRTYRVGGQEIVFRKTALKEVAFKHHISGLIVHALKALGPERVTPEVIATLRRQLNDDTRLKVLKDTRTATGWVRDVLLKIYRENR